MCRPPTTVSAAVRLSLGRWSTVADIDRAADLLAAAARRTT
jgi:selenocysteine lyase/cysteine desulfurase